MFQRYTDEAKRAIYYGSRIAWHQDAAAIDASHILLGLVADDAFRANALFRIRDLLQTEAAQISEFKRQHVTDPWALSFEQTSAKAVVKRQKGSLVEIGLTSDGKRVLANAAVEANQLRDYWIDTEHLVLGILREGSSSAANRLRGVGLDLDSCRRRVIANASSKPARRDPVLWWVHRRPIGFGTIAMFLFALGVAAALILLGYAAMGTAFAVIIAIQIFRLVIRGNGV